MIPFRTPFYVNYSFNHTMSYRIDINNEHFNKRDGAL